MTVVGSGIKMQINPYLTYFLFYNKYRIHNYKIHMGCWKFYLDNRKVEQLGYKNKGIWFQKLKTGIITSKMY